MLDTSAPSPMAPTRSELWRWCLRADAVASCFIRDVVELRQPEKQSGKEQDTIWWLGTVPCRSVKFVGMVVGARVFERRTMYTVDDGTGVIQCMHPHPPSTQARDEQKSKSKNNAISTQDQASRMAELPRPRYDVGETCRVIGRVEQWRDSRQIIVNEIEFCKPNDEPDHWIATAKLHEMYYREPFIIPPLPPPPVPKTPVKPIDAASAFSTPSTASTIVTPSTAASSLSHSRAIEQGPLRLRHPSRLRSKELIASTFKIYLKNYMDVLSDPSHGSTQQSPTKRAKRVHHHDHDNGATPRPKDKLYSLLQDSESTPRASYWTEKETSQRDTRPKGFTLSYLRRVPELADMACKLVEAETRRRAREARQKQKDAARAGKSTSKPLDQPPAEPTQRKMKRLYTWAIRELLKEGSIILHEDDGPVWERSNAVENSWDVWKIKSADDSTAAADSTASTTVSDLTGVTHGDAEITSDHGDLSDPPEGEESYLPLTPVMLMEPIMEAIKNMMLRKPLPGQKSRGPPGAYRSTVQRVVGPTAEELREYMGVVDSRWENVGEYTFADALELLKKQDKIYRVGRGRWEPVL